LPVFIAVDDLQLPEAEEQEANHPNDDVGDDGEPGLRQAIIAVKRKRHFVVSGFATGKPRRSF
jgi:hypothetical protein